jgi:hypothetical protein
MVDIIYENNVENITHKVLKTYIPTVIIGLKRGLHNETYPGRIE